MAAALTPFETPRVVANWAPSLLLQLDAYVAGKAVDKDEEIARKPVADLSPEERAHVVKESFSVDWELWVKPVARYAELLAKRGADLRKIDLARATATFSAQELCDLQVHFMLAWMGFAARREEPIVAELIRKERGYTHGEKIQLLDASRAIASRLLPRWRRLAERGLVEITCSPLYHPILPLLCDSDSARRAMPDVTLPPRFVHPEDARAQIERGLDKTRESFGARPLGMWPSEGSVSPEALQILGDCGVKWIATDQGNLERSDLYDRPQGALHFTPWKCGDVSIFFRDRDLSDAVGFRYARVDAKTAVQDLFGHVARAGDDACVTLALDGENPWEHYPRSGELFLQELYQRLEDDAVRSVLPREEIAQRPPRHHIARIHSGSWIDSNYRIWIGHPEDNQAWTLLGLARDAWAAAPSSPAKDAAYDYLLAAEGSDWFWWYGDDFTTENAPEFDALFRRNVAQVYRLLGLSAPERLGRPIIASHKDATQARAVVVPPRRLIAPVIDGYSHGYYEWSGAGLYRPGTTAGSSMYQGGGVFQQLWFGFSPTHLYLRLDPDRGFVATGELQMLITRPNHDFDKTLRMRLGDGDCPVLDERNELCGNGRCGAIVELSIKLEVLGLTTGDSASMLLRYLRDDVELDRLPRYGELALSVPDESFERAYWHV
jgi:alpha-amylase/alpha-mannosidase (GH57 family)